MCAQARNIRSIAAADTAANDRGGADTDAQGDAGEQHRERKSKCDRGEVLRTELTNKSHLEGLYYDGAGHTHDHGRG